MAIFLQITYITLVCLLQLNDFNLPFIVSGFIIFLIGLFACWIIAYIIKYRKPSAIFAFSHQVFILYFFYEFLKVKHDADAGFIWMIPIIIDKPISLLFSYAISIMYKVYDLYGVGVARIVPFVFFSIFGSLQYYLVGRFIDFIVFLIKKWGKKRHHIREIRRLGGSGEEIT